VEITFKGKASKVSVKGSWDQWVEHYELEDFGENFFSMQIPVDYGLHQFKYFVDGEWKLQEGATNIMHNEVGNYNHILYVGGDYKQRISLDWEGDEENVMIVMQPAWDNPIPMVHRDGISFLFLELPLGVYQYKYIVNGNWVHNPNKPQQNEDGIINNYIEVLPGKNIDQLFFSESCWIRYMVYLPPEYPNQFFTLIYNEYPLILSLHSAQVCGGPIENLKKFGLTKELEEITIPYIVIAPHSTYDYLFLDQQNILLELLDYITPLYRINNKRVYFTGVDNGAKAIWKLSSKIPNLITAMALIYNFKCEIDEEEEDNLIMSHIPLWYFDCEQNTGLTESLNLISRLKEYDSKLYGDEESIKVTLYPPNTDAQKEAYSNTELYFWFFNYSKQL